MRNLFCIVALLGISLPAVAHEMTPTYPTFSPSYVSGLASTKMSVFNARDDVDFYEVAVYNPAWEPVPFAATDKILHVPFAEKKSFDVYVRDEDIARAVYICTLSKLRSDKPSNAIISSKICSRTDRAEFR
jgi:hypothetical protein